MMRFFLKSFITLLYSSLSLGANKKGLRALKYHSIRKEQKDDNLWSLDINSFSDHFSFLVDAASIILESQSSKLVNSASYP